MNVEKQKFSEKLKGKGYYVLLLVGVASIALVAFIGTRLSSNKGNDNEFVDLNEYNNVEKEEKGINLSKNNKSDEIVAEEPEAVAVDGKTVEAKTNNIQKKLKFTSEKGLSWPIKGDILMEYSMDN